MEASSRPLPPLGVVRNSVPKAFQESLFAVQHVVVIVDTKNHFALGFQVDGRAHWTRSSLSVHILSWRSWSKLLTCLPSEHTTFYFAIVSFNDHRRLVPFLEVGDISLWLGGPLMKQFTPPKKKSDFNPHAFLSTIGKGRDMASFQKKNTIFAQGDLTDGLFFYPQGKGTAQRSIGRRERGNPWHFGRR